MDDITFILEQEMVKGRPAGTQKKLKKISSNELRLFAISLARLLKGGVPLLKALNLMENVINLKKMKIFISDVKQEVMQGRALWQSLEAKPYQMPVFFIYALRAGEAAGALPKVLRESAEYFRKKEETQRKIAEALVYPSLVILTGILTFSVMMKFVIPRLAEVYANFDGQLPFITVMLLNLSRVFVPVLMVFFIVCVLCFFLFRRLLKENLFSLFMKLPKAGGFVSNFTLLRFAGMLSLLLESGITILSSLEIVKDAFSDQKIRNDIKTLRRNLEEGKGFSSGGAHLHWIDPITKMLIAAGEESGNFPESLEQAAKDSESKLESDIALLTKFIEPVLILIIGSMIGGMVVAMMLPIFDISSLIS